LPSQIKNKGANHDGLTPYFIWSQRAELNRRPTDYEWIFYHFYKELITGWFPLSVYFLRIFSRP